LLSSALLLATAAAAQAPARQGAERSGSDSGVAVMRKVHTEMISVVFDRLRENGFPAPDGTLEMYADSSRTHVVPRLAGSTLPDSAMNGVLEIMQAALAEWPADMPVMASFRLDAEAALNPPDTTAAGSAEFVDEPPHARRVADFHQMIQRMLSASGLTSLAMTRRLTAQLAMLVDPEGRVAAVEVEHPTGEAALDAFLVPMAYELHFYPARSVSVWVTLPLHFGRD